MTHLSININKIALLRNSRGRNFPDVRAFAARCLDLGVLGITLHPREDQRHARYADVTELQALCSEHGRELNVEGYPSETFLEVVSRARPAQCTLVPDTPGQLTSDHGWNVQRDMSMLKPIVSRLKDQGIRTSLFVDFDTTELACVQELGADRIELYTEPYAAHFGTEEGEQIWEGFRAAAAQAQALGLGVNAGHDLNLENLARFLEIDGILEVSIGHAFVVECIEYGLVQTIGRYHALLNRRCAPSAGA